MYTIGLKGIYVGKAVTESADPKMEAGKVVDPIGKVYKDTCKINQDPAEMIEHFEEGQSAPEIRISVRKMPKITFSIMNPEMKTLQDYVGGEAVSGTGFGMDGSEKIENKALKLVSEQGFDIFIPNASIEAVINADMSAKGIFLLDVTVTPCAITSGKPFTAVPKA